MIRIEARNRRPQKAAVSAASARTAGGEDTRGLPIVAAGFGCELCSQREDLLLGICGQGLEQCDDVGDVVHDFSHSGTRMMYFGAEMIIAPHGRIYHENIEAGEGSCDDLQGLRA